MRKTGLFALLMICLLFSLSSAVAAEMQAEDMTLPSYVFTENKIITSEEVTVKQYGEIMTDYSVIPIQAETGFIYNMNTAFYFKNTVTGNYFFLMPEYTNKRFLPGGGLLYAGFL